MDIVEALKKHFKTKTEITSLIGSGSAARVYYSAPKQGVKPPFIVLTVFDGESAEHLQGISGVASNRVEIDCCGSTPQQAYTLAEQVRLSIQTYRGTMQGLYVNGIISPGSYEREYEPPEKGSDVRRYWITRDYFCSYNETTTTI